MRPDAPIQGGFPSVADDGGHVPDTAIKPHPEWTAAKQIPFDRADPGFIDVGWGTGHTGHFAVQHPGPPATPVDSCAMRTRRRTRRR